ncbi:phosphatase PAP2 family protein [Photobacterium leiognathi subsp. mandapamensis]
MRVINKQKIAITLFLILLTSLFSIVLQGIDFTNSPNPFIAQTISIISFSAGNFGFLISIFILISIVYIINIKDIQKYFLIICFSLILSSGYIIKSSLKSVTEQPRPYVNTLIELGVTTDIETFMTLPDEKRSIIIDHISENVDIWRLQEWKFESDYSFPSGHMLFAAMSAIFWAPILLLNAHYKLASTIIIWATSVGISRIWLGMHRLEDLYASIFIAFILCLTIPTCARYIYNNHIKSNKMLSLYDQPIKI